MTPTIHEVAAMLLPDTPWRVWLSCQHTVRHERMDPKLLATFLTGDPNGGTVRGNPMAILAGRTHPTKAFGMQVHIQLNILTPFRGTFRHLESFYESESIDRDKIPFVAYLDSLQLGIDSP